NPGRVPLGRVGARFQVSGQTVVDVPPVIRGHVGWIEAKGFHRVDDGKRLLHLLPAIEAQKDVATGPDEGQRLERLATPDGAQDVDAGNNSTKVVCGPPHESEDVAGRKADDAAAAVEYLFVALAAEPYPVLDPLLLEGQLDQCSEWRGLVRQRPTVRLPVGTTDHGSSPVRSVEVRASTASSAASVRRMARPMASGICGRTASPKASTIRLAAEVPLRLPSAMRVSATQVESPSSSRR